MSWKERFRVLKYLGRGAFGTVYLCDFIDGPSRLRHGPVAVKRIRCPTIQAANVAMRETLTLINLECESVVTYLDCFIDTEEVESEGFCLNLVMNFCNSGDLRDILALNTRIPEPFLQRLMQQMAVALEYLSAHGICHRDISPGNVMIHQAGRPTDSASSAALFVDPSSDENEEILFQLVDFGCVRRIREDPLAQTIVGTPHYWCPEVFSFQSSPIPEAKTDDQATESEISPHLIRTGGSKDGYDTSKMDIFSFGAVCFNLMLGKEVQVYATLVKEKWGKAEEFFVREKRYSAELVSIVGEMVKIDVEERISAAEFLEKMNRLISRGNGRKKLQMLFFEADLSLVLRIFSFVYWKDALLSFSSLSKEFVERRWILASSDIWGQFYQLQYGGRLYETPMEYVRLIQSGGWVFPTGEHACADWVGLFRKRYEIERGVLAALPATECWDDGDESKGQLSIETLKRLVWHLYASSENERDETYRWSLVFALEMLQRVDVLSGNEADEMSPLIIGKLEKVESGDENWVTSALIADFGDVFSENDSERDELTPHSIARLPPRIVLKILREFFCLVLTPENINSISLLMFYGVFRMDITRSVFCIFPHLDFGLVFETPERFLSACQSVPCSQILTLSLDKFGENPIPPNFLQRMKRLRIIDGMLLSDPKVDLMHLPPKIREMKSLLIPHSSGLRYFHRQLKKLEILSCAVIRSGTDYRDIVDVADAEVKMALPLLKQLALSGFDGIPSPLNEDCPLLERMAILSSNIGDNFFGQFRFHSPVSLTEVVFVDCDLSDQFGVLFDIPSLTHIRLTASRFDVMVLSTLQFPEHSKLELIGMSRIHEIPIAFFQKVMNSCFLLRCLEVELCGLKNEFFQLLLDSESVFRNDIVVKMRYFDRRTLNDSIFDELSVKRPNICLRY